jgi:hypothetical protein
MVATAAYDPIVVEHQLTPLKVAELVERRTESAKLDYKRAYDPSDAKSRIMLVKHALAMANTAGGYVVFGVDDDGTLLGVESTATGRLDEATIRAQIAGYSSVPIHLYVDTRIEYEGKRLVIVTVLPLMDRIAVVNADGQYHDGSRQSFAFRKGDVLVRHGSASERWNQDDADYLFRRIALAHKDQWLQEFSRDLSRVVQLTRGDATLVIDEHTFEMSPEEFHKTVTQLLRESNG